MCGHEGGGLECIRKSILRQYECLCPEGQMAVVEAVINRHGMWMYIATAINKALQNPNILKKHLQGENIIIDAMIMALKEDHGPRGTSQMAQHICSANRGQEFGIEFDNEFSDMGPIKYVPEKLGTQKRCEITVFAANEK